MRRPRNENLTERELDVLKLSCFSKQEIAGRLFVTNATVCTHVGNIYSKLRVQNSAQALIKALKTGIITIDEVITNDI